MPSPVRGLVFVALGSLLAACSGNGGDPDGPTPGAPPTSPPSGPPAHVLVVTHTTGFRHSSIPTAEAALRAIGADSGFFDVEFCRTADDVRARLTSSGLTPFDAVFFANTTGNLGIPDIAAFLAWIAAGKSFLGAHSASDTYHDEAGYLAMLGGEFTTHGAIVEADVRVNQPANPVVAHLAPSFRMIDEWYRFKPAGAGHTILLSLDRVPADGVGRAGDPADLPIAWQKPYGSGRVFYTAMGHQEEVWNDARFRKHLLEAIRWAVGR